MKYQHYKGGIYTTICEAKNTETGEELVIYEDTLGTKWARPRDMFYGTLPNGKKRFTPVFEKGE